MQLNGIVHGVIHLVFNRVMAVLKNVRNHVVIHAVEVLVDLIIVVVVIVVVAIVMVPTPVTQIFPPCATSSPDCAMEGETQGFRLARLTEKRRFSITHILQK